MSEKKFTITFTGSRAQELYDHFVGYFWDGGLDQTIEEMFLENYGLDCEDMAMTEDGCKINTDGKHL